MTLETARAPVVSIATYHADPLYPRIERAVNAVLAKGKVVAPVDVLIGMDLLKPDQLEEWRRGQVPYLERVPVDVATEVPSLLEEVRRFHATSMSGKYYEAFPVSGQNCTEQSKGTDAFIAEFDRLVARCVREADTGPQPAVREAFELLFGLLRHIDEGHDDLIFFADEGSSWNVGVPWRTVLRPTFGAWPRPPRPTSSHGLSTKRSWTSPAMIVATTCRKLGVPPPLRNRHRSARCPQPKGDRAGPRPRATSSQCDHA